MTPTPYSQAKQHRTPQDPFEQSDSEQSPSLLRSYRTTKRAPRDLFVFSFDLSITSPNDIDGSSTDADTSQDSQKLIQVYECRRSKRVCKTAKCGTDGEDNAKK